MTLVHGPSSPAALAIDRRSQRIGEVACLRRVLRVGPETESVRAVSGIKGDVLEETVEEGVRLKVA